MNLTGEISVTGEIGKFHRCHRWWVVKLVAYNMSLETPNYLSFASKYGHDGALLKELATWITMMVLNVF